MANSLVVFPYSGDEDLRSFLVSKDIEPPATVGSVPTVALLETILHEADWPYSEKSTGGTVIWSAMFTAREESWPPINELTLHDGSMGFRLGPHYGPFHVAREVSRMCGPQVAVEGSGANTCLVVPSTTYEEFHLVIAEVPAPEDGRDREWSQPLSEEVKFAASMPEEQLTSPEAALEHALSGRRGHGQAATMVGVALRSHRIQDALARHPAHSLDDVRYAAIVERLRDHLRTEPIPAPGLVWALGQAGAEEDLAALAERLQDVEAAQESLQMASIILRRR